MAQTESEIEAKIHAEAKKLGWSSFKFSSPSNRGVADRLFTRNGVTLFVEVKRVGEKPTALQKKFLLDRRKERIPAFWTDNVVDIAYYLRRLKSVDHISDVDFSLDEHALKA